MKIFYIIVGTVSLTLGVIGIFLPLLPTTPFLLLAAAFYFRGSPRLYHWLLGHKYLGPYIRNFREHKALPLRAKVLSLTVMWTTIGYAVYSVGLLWAQIGMIAVSAAVTVYILSLKTLK